MALLHHSGIYFLARILAGSAAFAILAAFTRLLDPHAFGELALSVSGVAFFAVLVVEWSMLAMLRYLPGHSAVARATTLWGLILPAVAVCGMARVAFLLAAPERWRVQLALCAGLLIAILLHQFQLAAAQGALRPGKYALLGSFESVLDMVLDISLVLLGVGFAIAAMKMGRVPVTVTRFNHPRRRAARRRGHGGVAAAVLSRDRVERGALRHTRCHTDLFRLRFPGLASVQTQATRIDARLVERPGQHGYVRAIKSVNRHDLV
ncbi:MAG TPA: hypothetical protein VLN61_12920 [Pseudolabrys sp.]|nr:hypothetical protein [Pseudolabrys sp.]